MRATGSSKSDRNTGTKQSASEFALDAGVPSLFLDKTAGEREKPAPFGEPDPEGIDWIRTKAPFGSRVCFWLEDRSDR
jgi:hypothetical protein